MNVPHQADRCSGMRMGIQTAKRLIMDSWRKKLELERAWCVQGMQNNLRGRSIGSLCRYLGEEGTRTWDWPCGVKIWRILFFQVHVCQALAIIQPLESKRFSHLKLMCLCAHRYPRRSSQLKVHFCFLPEQWTVSRPQPGPGPGSLYKAAPAAAKEGWGPDVGGSQQQSIECNLKPGRAHLLTSPLSDLWEKGLTERSSD